MRTERSLLVGLDVGSTTVKAVVVDARSDAIVWQDYQRHETRQAEMALEFLARIERDVAAAPSNCHLFVTGSGGAPLADLVGGRYIQEVAAIALAVEKRHPEARSVVELGGQDAKIIIFEEDRGRTRKLASWRPRARRTSPSRTSTRTGRWGRSGSGWKRSTTRSSAIARSR